MAEGNVDRVHRGTDAFNKRDIDAFLALCDPEIEFTTRIMELEGGGPYRGHDDVRRWWKEVFEIFPNFSLEVEAVRDIGGVTVTRLRQQGQGLGSDAPTERQSWQVSEWRDGKTVWLHVFQSEDEAIEAAEGRQ